MSSSNQPFTDGIEPKTRICTLYLPDYNSATRQEKAQIINILANFDEVYFAYPDFYNIPTRGGPMAKKDILKITEQLPDDILIHKTPIIGNYNDFNTSTKNNSLNQRLSDFEDGCLVSHILDIEKQVAERQETPISQLDHVYISNFTLKNHSDYINKYLTRFAIEDLKIFLINKLIEEIKRLEDREKKATIGNDILKDRIEAIKEAIKEIKNPGSNLNPHDLKQLLNKLEGKMQATNLFARAGETLFCGAKANSKGKEAIKGLIQTTEAIEKEITPTRK